MISQGLSLDRTGPIAGTHLANCTVGPAFLEKGRRRVESGVDQSNILDRYRILLIEISARHDGQSYIQLENLRIVVSYG